MAPQYTLADLRQQVFQGDEYGYLLDYVNSGGKVAVGTQVTLNAFATPLATQGTWAYLVNGAYPLNGIQYNTSGAQGDWIEFGIDLAAGTYTIDIGGEIGPDQGITTLTLDGEPLTTIDFYGAVTTVGRKTATGVVVVAPVGHTLRLAVLAKNASSSGYGGRFSFITFTRTA